jgi:hypothetical protein
MKEAYVDDQMDKIKRMAEKKGKKVDENTLKFALGYQGNKIAGPDLIVKSNTRGYKFSNVKLANVNKALADEAIKAVESLGLQFGAVDCVLDADGAAWVIEVNTGPGLEGTAFKNYVNTLADMINNILKPPKVTGKKSVDPSKVTKAANGSSTKSAKPDAEKLRMLADMLDHTENESEAALVNEVAARMFNKKASKENG